MKKVINALLQIAVTALLCLSLSVAAQTTAQVATHIVERGETLNSIAQKYGVTEQQILDINPDAAQFIYVGMELNIPTTKNVMTTPVEVDERIVVPASNNYQTNIKDDSGDNRISSPDNSIQTGLMFDNSGSEYYGGTSSVLTCFAIQAGIGYSNFIWDNGSVNGDISYLGEIAAQLYFEDNVGFIPQNWFSELGVGYMKMGAAKLGMNYAHARIYPLGYRVPLSNVDLVIKGGVSLGFPLSKLKTDSNSWKGNFQCGIGGGLSVDFNRFSIGCNVEYDFTEVSSSCGQKLNNIAVLGTISYKFAKL